RLVENTDLSRAAHGGSPTLGELEHRTAILAADAVLVKDERIDRRRASDVHVVVAEINTDRSACGRDNFLEFQAIAVTLVDRNRSGAVVHGSEQLAFELADAARIATRAAFALRRQCL